MKLTLPNVTLCAVTSVNIEATVIALRHSASKIDFGDCILFTDADADLFGTPIRKVAIERLKSGRGYSHFVLERLADHIPTEYCLIIQWDGFILDPEKWQPAFLDHDYIGAPWPQFDDGHDVGNGGFSLRSRRLMDACGQAGFQTGHPEDVMIGRVNRPFLESCGIRIADSALATRFSCERSGSLDGSFGFHGVFNMVEAIGADAFWRLYEELDDRTTIWRDLDLISSQLAAQGVGLSRRLRLRTHRIMDFFRKRRP